MACGKSEVQLSAAARGTARVEVVRRCAARLLRFAGARSLAHDAAQAFQLWESVSSSSRHSRDLPGRRRSRCSTGAGRCPVQSPLAGGFDPALAAGETLEMAKAAPPRLPASCIAALRTHIAVSIADAAFQQLRRHRAQRCVACHPPRVALSGSNHCSHSEARASRCWADSRAGPTATTTRPRWTARPPWTARTSRRPHL